MAETHDDDMHVEDTPGYKAPEKKTMGEILEQDQDDPSLIEYKKKLLGETGTPFPNDPRQVIVSRLTLLSDGQNDMELDLTKDVGELKKTTFVIKEGCHYKIRISFYVQREIVTGLKYVQSGYRAGVRVDKSPYMVGSYGPKMELQSYTTPVEEAPSGMVSRGSYKIKSLFTDDDKNEHLKWEWVLEIKKDWK